MNILLIDDHSIIRLALRELIAEDRPKSVFKEASNLREAVELCKQFSFNLILLDLAMPDAESGAAVKVVKQVAGSTPILVVSFHEGPSYAARALADGASGYLVKANALSELKVATETVLSGRIYVGADLVDYLTSSLVDEGLRKNPIEQLSRQELLVMNYIADGCSLSQIAERMNLSAKTIETYRARLLKKLGLKSNNELVKFLLANNKNAD